MRKDIIDSAGSGSNSKKDKFFSIVILILIIIAIGGFAILRSDTDFSVGVLSGEVTKTDQNAEEETESVATNPETDDDADQIEHYEEGVDNGGVVFEETERTYNGSGYAVVAKHGDGLTHVARKALASHLQNNGGNDDLTAEHKVYIEDYIQKRIDHPTGWLEVGETIQVSESLINEAIEAANQLTDNQLQNLSQYTF